MNWPAVDGGSSSFVWIGHLQRTFHGSPIAMIV
jgi:hypothetical protein